MWFNWCCCDPCGVHTAGFASDHDAGAITPTGLADWPLDSGEAEFDGAGANLEYTVPVEARTSPLVARIRAKMVNASTAGGGIYIVVDGVTVSLTVDAETDDVTLAFGDFEEVVGEWTADGADLGLTITATECLSWVRWEIGDVVGQESTTQVEFDPLDTEYLMGVIGNAGGCEGPVSDCCPGQCRADPVEIDQDFPLTMGGVTGNATGSLPWDEANSRWHGNVTRTYNGGSPTVFDVKITEVDCEASPPVYGISIDDGPVTNSISSTCNPFTITFDGPIFIDFPVTGTPDTVFTGTIPGGGAGTRVDDVRLTACGEVPERDCGRPDGGCSCPDGEVFPCLTLEMTFPPGTFRADWGPGICLWGGAGFGIPIFVDKTGIIQVGEASDPLIYERDAEQPDPSCMDVSGTYTATNGSGHTVTITMGC